MIAIVLIVEQNCMDIIISNSVKPISIRFSFAMVIVCCVCLCTVHIEILHGTSHSSLLHGWNPVCIESVVDSPTNKKTIYKREELAATNGIGDCSQLCIVHSSFSNDHCANI